MSSLKHNIATFLVMGTLISLLITAWAGFTGGYGLTDQDIGSPGDGEKNNMTVMTHLNNLNMMNEVGDISKNLYNIVTPANAFDLVGALASAAIGVIKLLSKIVLFPFNIMNLVGFFYAIPGPIVVFIQAMVYLSIGFIILVAFTRTDL